MKVPNVVDIHSLHLPDVLRKADLHKMQSELMTCLPSLPHMPDLHKLRESSMDLLPSLPSWHVMDLLYNCLPERFSQNHTDVCVLVMIVLPLYLPHHYWLYGNAHFTIFFLFSISFYSVI